MSSIKEQEARGPFGKWLPVPKLFPAIEKAGKLPQFLELLKTSSFSAKGDYITCGLCYEHSAHNATISVKKSFPFKYGKFSEHFLTSQCHKSSEQAASSLKNRSEAHLKRHGRPMEEPIIKKQKGLLTLGFVQLASKDKGIETGSPVPRTNVDMLCAGEVRTNHPQVAGASTEASMSEKRRQMRRAIATQRSSSFELQLKDLPANMCLGCLDWNDITNEKLQLGFEYTSKYYCGMPHASGYSCTMVPGSTMYSIFSTKCTSIGE